MQKTNPFTAWLGEMFLRITAKSPKFFQVWQYISGAVLAITGLAEFLQQYQIVLPLPWQPYVTKIVAIASGVALFMSSLPVKAEPIGTDNNGTVIKTNNEAKLPFTADQEKKELAKDGLK